MPREPITNKTMMYSLLASGQLGNTIPNYFSIEEWRASGDAERYPVWAVRTKSPGGPVRFYLPTDEVEQAARELESYGISISIMIDACVPIRLWADVYIGVNGLTVYGMENPPKGGSWRVLMPVHGRTYERLSAVGILQKHLNPPSLSDLYELLEDYPDHVVELSACASNVGIFPHRNMVIWEVRVAFGALGGVYEEKVWRQNIPSKWEMRRRLDGD